MDDCSHTEALSGFLGSLRPSGGFLLTTRYRGEKASSVELTPLMRQDKKLLRYVNQPRIMIDHPWWLW